MEGKTLCCFDSNGVFVGVPCELKKKKGFGADLLRIANIIRACWIMYFQTEVKTIFGPPARAYLGSHWVQ